MGRKPLIVVAMCVFAGLLAQGGSPKRVQAAFPGTNGKIVYERQVSTTQTDVVIADADGSNAQAIASEGFVRNLDPVISPDGTKVLYVSSSGGAFQIWQMNSDGSNKDALIQGAGISEFSAPAWSPDMKFVVFIYAGSVWRFRFSDEQFLQLTNSGLDGRPQYSPDGTKIAFDRYFENPPADIFQNDIFVMNADGTGQTNITNTSIASTADDDEFGPTWSPDGTRIAFWGSEGDSEIFAVDANGSNRVNLTQSAADEIEPAWSPDGTAVLFVDLHFSDGVDQSRLAYVQVSGVPTPTFITDAIGAGNPDWGPGVRECTVGSASIRGPAKEDESKLCKTDWTVTFSLIQHGVPTDSKVLEEPRYKESSTLFDGVLTFDKEPKPGKVRRTKSVALTGNVMSDTYEGREIDDPDDHERTEFVVTHATLKLGGISVLKFPAIVQDSDYRADCVDQEKPVVGKVTIVDDPVFGGDTVKLTKFKTKTCTLLDRTYAVSDTNAIGIEIGDPVEILETVE